MTSSRTCLSTEVRSFDRIDSQVFETSKAQNTILPHLPTERIAREAVQLCGAEERSDGGYAAEVSMNPAGDAERGSLRVKVVPFPISLSTRILP